MIFKDIYYYVDKNGYTSDFDMTEVEIVIIDQKFNWIVEFYINLNYTTQKLYAKFFISSGNKYIYSKLISRRRIRNLIINLNSWGILNAYLVDNNYTSNYDKNMMIINVQKIKL